MNERKPNESGETWNGNEIVQNKSGGTWNENEIVQNESGNKWNEDGVQAGDFEAFRQVVAALRAPDGCPWDREQTFESLKPCMINEMTEALAAIDIYRETKSPENLCEELGDVLLQVVLLAQIAQEEGLFTIEDVVRGISRKMIRRHPHVFGETMFAANANSAIPSGDGCRTESEIPSGDARGTESEMSSDGRADTKPAAAEEIPGLWEAIKRAEKKHRTPEMEQMEKEAFRVSAAEVIRHLKGKL